MIDFLFIFDYISLIFYFKDKIIQSHSVSLTIKEGSSNLKYIEPLIIILSSSLINKVEPFVELLSL